MLCGVGPNLTIHCLASNLQRNKASSQCLKLLTTNLILTLQLKAIEVAKTPDAAKEESLEKINKIGHHIIIAQKSHPKRRESRQNLNQAL